MIKGSYLLKKFPGKGGWTYTEIPEIKPDKSNPFGWVTVKGKIDSFAFDHYKLMPMGNGTLFLPVRAEVRKLIKKEAGDWVEVELSLDKSPIEIPEELRECLLNESKKTYQAFFKLSEGSRKGHIDRIFKSKSEDTKAARIIELIEKLSKIDHNT